MERTYEYICYRGKSCDIVRMGIDWFDYRADETELPKAGAFCKKCARETAKPVHPIFMNGQPAYALRCEKCGSEYPMYKNMYIERYVGYNTKYGHVNPTHGVRSIVSSMDRNARIAHNNRRKAIEDEMCNTFGVSHEKYKEMKNEWEVKKAESHRKFKREQAELEAKFEEEERKAASEKRKELIASGVLQYVKNIGLVNTQTGEVVKL